jgi:hypothetical protein
MKKYYRISGEKCEELTVIFETEKNFVFRNKEGFEEIFQKTEINIFYGEIGIFEYDLVMDILEKIFVRAKNSVKKIEQNLQNFSKTL